MFSAGSVELIIHNVGYIVGSTLVLAFTALVYIKDHKPLANKMMIAAFLSTAVFTLSHVIGVNIPDPALSRDVLLFNVATLIATAFFAHAIIALLGKTKEQRMALIIIYTNQITLFIFFIIFPYTYLLESVPKMYFPDYYVAGNLYILVVISNALIPLYFLYQMARSYRTAESSTKNRIKWLFASFLLGYSFAYAAVPLVYGIPTNPVWSVFFAPLMTGLLTYAILKYDILDIKIVAKQAFVYSVLVAIVGLFISFFNFANDFIVARIPDFPSWVFPLVSSFIAVSIGFFIWKKLRETDLLKYEFVTVVTHKFRTPLTYIKWATDSLAKAPLPVENQNDIRSINEANRRLVDLTNLLVNLSDSGGVVVSEPTMFNVYEMLRGLVSDYTQRFKDKSIRFEVSLRDQSLKLRADSARLKSVFQILLENAINYSGAGGKVIVSLVRDGHFAIIQVADNGIGIPKNELPRLFSKFYRGLKAKQVDTEGMGIGLFMSKEIIEKIGGKIWAESEGEGKGSTFFIKFPLA